MLKCKRKNTVSLTRALRLDKCSDSLPAHLRAGLHPRRSWSSYQAFDEVSVRLLFNWRQVLTPAFLKSWPVHNWCSGKLCLHTTWALLLREEEKAVITFLVRTMCCLPLLLPPSLEPAPGQAAQILQGFTGSLTCPAVVLNPHFMAAKKTIYVNAW